MSQEDSPGGKRILKATLEATFQAQEKIRKHLEVLIKENRCLKDEQERDLFLRELTYSTLGLGVNTVFVITVFKGTGQEEWGNVEYRARRIAQMTTNHKTVRKQIFTGGACKEYEEATIPISRLWEIVLDCLFEVFPRSLDRACGLSREQDSSGKSMGHMVSDE